MYAVQHCICHKFQPVPSLAMIIFVPSFYEKVQPSEFIGTSTNVYVKCGCDLWRGIGCVLLQTNCYLPIHIIFETLEAVTTFNIWRVIPNEPSEVPSRDPSGE